MGIIEVWTIISLVLHFCGIGAFAEWPVIANPFSWSCLCLEIWVFVLYISIPLLYLLIVIISEKK